MRPPQNGPAEPQIAPELHPVAPHCAGIERWHHGGVLMLWPLLVFLLLALFLWNEERSAKAWREHPNRPWNVSARIARENLEWYRATYQPPPGRRR